MLSIRRLASYRPKGQGEAGYEAAKAILIALIVICLTVIVTALVTRKDLCEVQNSNRPDGGHCLHSPRI